MVVLPKDAEKRMQVFVVGSHAAEAFDCDAVTDRGQKYLYFGLD